MFIFSRRAPRARLDTLAGQIRTAGRSLETTALGGKALADPELQKRGAKFLPKFLNDLFLGVSRKNFIIFPQNFHLSPKISDDLFLVIDLLFNVFNVVFSVGEAKSVADIDTGGPISLLFDIFTMLSLLFLSIEGGQTPLPTSMGGHGRICPPWIHHCI